LIKRILVAVDGSESSEHALNEAIEHAAKWNAELIMVSVVPPISPLAYMGPSPLYLNQYKEAARESHQRVLTRSRTKIKNEHPDIDVETRLEEDGRPADVIVEIARDEDVDMIVMGNRGIGGITGWVLGSTSRRVVDSCTKPILIVK
jgi:nucleotide-binding universal stress UspA family protein